MIPIIELGLLINWGWFSKLDLLLSPVGGGLTLE